MVELPAWSGLNGALIGFDKFDKYIFNPISKQGSLDSIKRFPEMIREKL